ncbi:phage head-tail connector protein [Novosphingobium sp. ES2-1]|uniref:head-tail connector protein n=1 Tax=Novosphingobium sp. ES2-1 TaxID=2780074 RepID=UPI001882FD5C|nr:phage head-tail connector protein [Novosphingobium sp. ES2-1]QOV92996.1 phage head-tail connector protein [Novosphingobium sp. ES2-1]
MSEIVTIEPPQDRPVTLEEARQQLRLDTHDEDMLLAIHLDAAQAELEWLADLRVCPQTLAMVLDAWPDEITVPVRPVTIAAITYTATSGATVSLPEADYVARARHGFMRIRPAAGKSWPELAPDGQITITLSAGFAEDHPNLEISRAAVLVKTASLFENREGASCLAFDTLVNQLAARWV